MNNHVAESGVPASEGQSIVGQTTSSTAEPAQSPIAVALQKLLKGMEDLREAAKVAGPAVVNWQKEEIDKQRKKIGKYISDSLMGSREPPLPKGPTLLVI